MMIRRAAFEDIPSMVELGRQMHVQSANADLEFDVDGARLMGAQAMSLRTHCAFVAEEEGKIVGVLLGLVRSFGFLHATYATDAVFFARKGGKALLKRFLQWAHEKGADKVVLNVTFGGRSVDGTAALYTRMGFDCVGGVFLMEMK